jgi:hypothetical protein
MRELYFAAPERSRDDMITWLYRVPGPVTYEAAASLLLAAIEAEQEPDADQPRLWEEWLAQAQRDGIPQRDAIRLAFRAAHISRQLFTRKD